MESLACGLFERHETELQNLPDALHLDSDVLVTVCQGMDAIVQHELLVVKRAQSTFLGLEMRGVMRCMVASERGVMMSTDSMPVNCGMIAANSYLDPVDLVEFAPEATISDEVLFWVVELGLELLMS